MLEKRNPVKRNPGSGYQGGRFQKRPFRRPFQGLGFLPGAREFRFTPLPALKYAPPFGASSCVTSSSPVLRARRLQLEFRHVVGSRLDPAVHTGAISRVAARSQRRERAGIKARGAAQRNSGNLR